MTIKLVNHTDTVPQITNFSSERYTSRDFMDAEWESVWRDTWLLAGLASDVAHPGDFFVFDIGREQILLTHTNSGAIQGFYNVCQHRGNQLVTTERGHAASFRCAYHAWTYDIDGALKSVPYKERFAHGVPCEERSLKPVHTALWDGFVFVSLAEHPPELEAFLGPLVEQLAPYRFRDMTLLEDQSVTHQCNWKAVVDNFSELYHVDFLHPQHKRMVDCCNDTVHLFDNGHTGLAVPGATVNPRFPVPDVPTDLQSAQLQSLGLDPAAFKGRVLDVRKAVQTQKRLVGPEKGLDYSEFTDDQLSDVWQYNLFPNVILSFTPEHCWVMRVRPHPSDPERCTFDKLSLLKYGSSATPANGDGSGQTLIGPGREQHQSAVRLSADYKRPERDSFDHVAIVNGEKTMTDTIDQDIALLGGVQRGMASQGFDRVWLNDDEMRIQHFHNELDRRLSRPASVP